MTAVIAALSDRQRRGGFLGGVGVGLVTDVPVGVLLGGFTPLREAVPETLRDGLTVDVCRGGGGTLFAAVTVTGCFGGRATEGTRVDDPRVFEVLGTALGSSGANTSTLKSKVRRSAPCIAPMPITCRASSSPF